MKENSSRKCLAIGVTVIFIITVMIPVVNSQLTRLNTIKEKIGINKCSLSEKEIATVYMTKYDKTKGIFIKEPVKEITRDEAEDIKEELLAIEETCSSSEDRIRNQIDVMHKWDLLPSEATFDNFLMLLDRMRDNISLPRLFNNSSSAVPSAVICGPCLISFLVISGSYLPLHKFLYSIPGLEPWIYFPFFDNLGGKLHIEDLLGGTSFAGWIAAMPLLFFATTTITYVNILGFHIGVNHFKAPMTTIMVPHAGVNIAATVFDNVTSLPVNIFDFEVGVSGLGLIVYTPFNGEY